MRPEYHFIVSMVLSLGLFVITNSPLAALLCFISGFLIDLDHFVDYWIYKKRITFSKEFFSEYHMQFGKFYVLLHSFDVLLLVLVLLLYFDLGILALGVLVGAGVHLAMDVIGNPVSIQGYFLICRIHKRFDFRVFLRKSLL